MELTPDQIAALLRIQAALRDEQLDRLEHLILRTFRVVLQAIDRESNEIAADLANAANDPKFAAIKDRLEKHLAALRAMGKTDQPTPTTPTTKE